MNRSFKTVALGLLAVAGALAAGVAHACSYVYWSVDINAPGHPVGVGASFSNALVVYPEPVYVAPPPVIYVPRRVYVQPRPIYYYGPPAYYYGERGRHRHHRRREHDD